MKKLKPMQIVGIIFVLAWLRMIPMLIESMQNSSHDSSIAIETTITTRQLPRETTAPPTTSPPPQTKKPVVTATEEETTVPETEIVETTTKAKPTYPSLYTEIFQHAMINASYSQEVEYIKSQGYSVQEYSDNIEVYASSGDYCIIEMLDGTITSKYYVDSTNTKEIQISDEYHTSSALIYSTYSYSTGKYNKVTGSSDLEKFMFS